MRDAVVAKAKHNPTPLGPAGEPTLRRQLTALVRVLAQPGVSPNMALKLTREINALKAEIAKLKVERARRAADRLLDDSASDKPPASQ